MQRRFVPITQTILILLALSTTRAQVAVCNLPSDILPGGCKVIAPARIHLELHYLLHGLEPTSNITIALRGSTPGYLSIAFGPSTRMFPSDAVFGWMTDTGVAQFDVFALQGYRVYSSQRHKSYKFIGMSASEVDDMTTIVFSRTLGAGNYPIDPRAFMCNIAWGFSDSVSKHAGYVQLEPWDVAAGFQPAVQARDGRDFFWVVHGSLAIVAWGFFVPHAIVFAMFQGKVSGVLGSPGIWFHLHVFSQLIAMSAHFIVLSLPFTSFGTFSKDRITTAHSVLAWTTTALLTLQWPMALFLRPNKTDHRRPLWNLLHFACGRIMFVLAIATISLGIHLYSRKSSPYLLMTRNAWIAFLVAALGTALLSAGFLSAIPQFDAESTKSNASNTETTSGAKMSVDKSSSVEIVTMATATAGDEDASELEGLLVKPC